VELDTPWCAVTCDIWGWVCCWRKNRQDMPGMKFTNRMNGELIGNQSWMLLRVHAHTIVSNPKLSWMHSYTNWWDKITRSHEFTSLEEKRRYSPARLINPSKSGILWEIHIDKQWPSFTALLHTVWTLVPIPSLPCQNSANKSYQLVKRWCLVQ
jgi:hypothetical protein